MNFVNIISKKRIVFAIFLIASFIYILHYEYTRETHIVEGFWKKATRAINKAAKSTSNAVVNTTKTATGGIQTGALVVGSGVQTGASVVGTGVQTGASVVGSGVQTGASVVGSGVQTGISKAGAVLENAFDALKMLEIGKLIKQIKGTFQDSLLSVGELGAEFNTELSNYVDKLQNIS